MTTTTKPTTKPGHALRSRAVGLVVHGGREDARKAAAEAAALLERRGAEVWAHADDEWDQPPGVRVADGAEFADGLDVVLVFGGDGTFLRAAYETRDHGVPLLGVNLGRLGFLSEIAPDEVTDAVERIVAGDYTVEERMTLAVEVADENGEIIGGSWALNEASFERTQPQRLIVLEVRVGQELFATVPADGLICATPTGSTAYAFSARGPITSPLVDAILLVPVAPHSLFDRTLVIDPRESLVIAPVGDANRCVVSLDGRETVAVPVGGSVLVTRGEKPVRLAKLSPGDFYQRVRAKFRLA